MTRNWQPCRVCGRAHHNPSSSSICEYCGALEREAATKLLEEERQAYEESPFGRFMAMPEEERWRMLFDHMMDRMTDEHD